MVNNANIREKKNRILSAHPERLRSPYKKKVNCNQWDTTANGGLGKGALFIQALHCKLLSLADKRSRG